MLQVVVDEWVKPLPNSKVVVDEWVKPSPNSKVVVDERVTPLPNSNNEATEFSVDVRLLPLRLTVDQDTVEFVNTFLHLLTLPTYVETAATDADSPVNEDLPQKFEADCVELKEIEKRRKNEIMFQQISISPLLLSIDYRAKRLDMEALRRGEVWQLCNLLPLLEGLDVCFHRVKMKNVRGVENVINEIVQCWTRDIDRAQVLRMFMGVTPIRSLANIGVSMSNLVREPLQQYFGHSGSRGLLRGLTSSLRNITVETLSLSETMFVSAQNIFEYAEAHVSSPSREQVRRPIIGEDTILPDSWTPLESGVQEFTIQPQTAGEGLSYGFAHLQRSLRSASKVFHNPVVEMRRDEEQSVMSACVRGIPVMILRPAIGASACAATTLRGMKNQVDAQLRKKALDKYKGPRMDEM